MSSEIGHEDHQWLGELIRQQYEIVIGPDLFQKQKFTSTRIALASPERKKQWVVLAKKYVEGTVYYSLFYNSIGKSTFNYRKKSVPLDTTCNVVDGNHEQSQEAKKGQVTKRGTSKAPPNWFSVHVGMGLRPSGEALGLLAAGNSSTHRMTNVRVLFHSAGADSVAASEQHARWLQAVWRARQGDQAVTIAGFIKMPGNKIVRDKLEQEKRRLGEAFSPGSHSTLIPDRMNPMAGLNDEFD